MALPSRHKKSYDHSNTPQQKPVLGKKKENEKNKLCSEFFFFVCFSSMSSSFCMKVSFSQVCKKSCIFPPILSSLEQKNENDSKKKQRSPKSCLRL